VIRRSLAGSLAVAMLMSPTAVSGSEVSSKRPITVEECVQTRRIPLREVKMSPDGGNLAFVVKAPDIATNRNHYTLYLRSLAQRERRENGRKMMEADNISEIQWLGSQKLVARVQDSNGKINRDQLIILNVQTGAREAIDCPPGTRSFSITPDADTIVFSRALSDPSSSPLDVSGVTPADRLRGYRIPMRVDATFFRPADCEIKVYSRKSGGRFQIRTLSFTGPDALGPRSTLWEIESLRLAPNGKYLLFSYWSDQLPEQWERQPVIQQFRTMHSPGALYIFGLCDMNSGRIRYGFNQSGAFIMEADWAADSRSYAVVSPSPFGSPEGDAEQQAARESESEYYYMYRFGHLFSVNVGTGLVTRILSRDSGLPGIPEYRYDGALGQKTTDGEFVARTDVNEFARFSFKDGAWKEENRVSFTEREARGFSFTSDGELLAGVAESPNVRPDILLVDTRTGERTVLTDLNPEFDQIELGHIERIEWTNRFGSNTAGELLKPPGYEPGKRYPFVLMATATGGWFTTDNGNTTAYAPQSLADAGFIVLFAKYPLDNKIPKGTYPGEMREAFNFMGMVESAIDLLSSQGMIDPRRIGIVGFSRTAWLVDFVLSHSSYHFQAASAADGISYGYADYSKYLDMGVLLDFEHEIGGPPYGETFKNWLAYAVPFNANHIDVPLLMEYTVITSSYELFTQLTRQGKPVELYYYPQGAHPLDTPLGRVSSLRRNVDWFRFWLQGYERPAPEDSNQYVRWRALRAAWNHGG
jgi:dipeptidyl aminopeptidase/acylaminoacyl peptidase